MKKVLGLDLGTNSIGWSLVKSDFGNKEGKILGLGSRIIPMSQDVLGKFDSGASISQTAERTGYRGTRRLYQRDNLRRERLHRVLNILGFLPEHYSSEIDFEKHYGQFKKGKEPKINYKKGDDEKFKFIFMDSFLEMVKEFKEKQPNLFYKKKNGVEAKIPLDWTLYYLRKKALTQKILKEELAWVILNFNQKRGYYQLRGEDEEESTDDKKKEFIVLKVKKVIDSGEEVKGNKLYDVVFDNEWVYDKQITKTENWINKEKEFIVTTSIKKNGETKRSYKAVNSEEDWIAIKEKTQQEIDRSGKNVGEYIYETILKNPKQKVRGKLVKTIERKFYKDELKAILKEQVKYHAELQDRGLYQSCIEELYPRNESHQNSIKVKSFEYLFVDDIIFYQRPLKSKKSTISNCKFENKIFFADGKKQEQPIKATPKSHPLFQEFRLWQFIKNLKIYQKEKTVDGSNKFDIDITDELFKTENDWIALFEFLNTKKEVEQTQIIQFFISKKLIDKNEKNNYRWNYVEDKKYPANETKAQFISKLKKVKDLDIATFLTPEMEYKLWHIIYSVKDKKEYEKAIENFAKKNIIDKESFENNFKRFPPYKSDYGAYSEKALKKLLPLIRIGERWSEENIHKETKERIEKILTGEYDENIQNRVREKAINLEKIEDFKGLPLWLSEYIVYDRHSESSDGYKWKSPKDIDAYLEEFKQHSLRNPIVEQVITETLRVVRDIWIEYGESQEDFFDEIHIELGREMKNDKKQRENISKRNMENENTNYRIKELLKEMVSDGARVNSPSHQEILKIYDEGVYQSSEERDDIVKIRRQNAPSKSDIQKYKLWLEQKYISPYTGEVISLSKLFSTEYQIEHIIPQSRYFDNSLSNKVICESAINPNPYKDNQTGFEFIKNQGGSTIPELSTNSKTVKLFTLEQYQIHCKRYFAKNRTKLEKLLSEEIPEKFINRQLNDTRYISKFIKGLLSNIVREEDEQEVTSKNIVTVTGKVTTELKHNWGLNDKWNELITPRFERLNKITNSNNFGFWDKSINAFRTRVPDEISKGFNKKRIDHRHHALDALVIACASKNHVSYLTNESHVRKNKSKDEKNKIRYDLKHQLCFKTKPNDKGNYNWEFKLPWQGFPVDAKNILEKTVISFKQNLRVTTKTNNKTWQWKEKDGKIKNQLETQKKGNSRAIRKPIHAPLPYGGKTYSFSVLEISKNIGKREFIADDEIKVKIEDALVQFDGKIGNVQKYLKKNPITDNSGSPIVFTVFNIHEKRYRKRQPIQKLSNRGQGGIKTSEQAIKFINKVSDIVIRQDLLNHLKENNYDIDKAFSIEGIENFNSKRKIPVYKLPISEASTSKFPLGKGYNTKVKFGEAESGTNLFFAIYWNKEKQKREYETIPLNDVIKHQKWRATLPKEEMKQTPIIPINFSKGQFLFSLSPNDLVYMPTDEESEYPNNVDFEDLSEEQVGRIYKIVSSTGNRVYAIPNTVSKSIKNKFEFSSINKMEFDLSGYSIKQRCWKLKVNRLGNVVKVGEY